MLTGGLLPFPRTGCVLYAKAILSHGPEIRQAHRYGLGRVPGRYLHGTLEGVITRPSAGELVRVLPTVRIPAGGLNLVYPSTRPVALKISAFRDFLVQTIENEWV